MDLHFFLHVLHVNLKNPQKPKQRPQTNTINPKQNQHLPAYYDVCVFLSDKRKDKNNPKRREFKLVYLCKS